MVSSYVKLDENEGSIIPFQGPSSLGTTECKCWNIDKELHKGLSVALGKLYHCALNLSFTEWTQLLAFRQSTPRVFYSNSWLLFLWPHLSPLSFCAPPRPLACDLQFVSASRSLVYFRVLTWPPICTLQEVCPLARTFSFCILTLLSNYTPRAWVSFAPSDPFSGLTWPSICTPQDVSTLARLGYFRVLIWPSVCTP